MYHNILKYQSIHSQINVKNIVIQISCFESKIVLTTEIGDVKNKIKLLASMEFTFL